MFDNANETIKSLKLLEIGRLNPNSFTRKRKLSFVDLIGIMLNFNNRTLQIEIDDYLEYVAGTESLEISKQAFSKARQNLNPKVFSYLSDELVKPFYCDNKFSRVNDFRVLAVDGTSIELSNFQHLREHFGHVGNENQTVRAYASVLFDIANEVVIDSEISNYRTDERTLAKNHLAKLKDIGYKNDLILYDRGYPSRELMAYHFDEKIDFVMRCKESFLDKKRVFTEPRDEEYQFEFNQKKYIVRRVQFMLPSGQIETLVTSLSNESLNDLMYLYSLRWGVETQYNALKNILQIENFSGYTVLAIEQDFYATMYLNNLAAGILYDFRNKETENSQSHKKKYSYKINRNELYGNLKFKLIKAILTKNLQERIDIISKIMRKIERNMIPIRPNRHYQRKKVKRCGIKFPVNQRKSI